MAKEVYAYAWGVVRCEPRPFDEIDSIREPAMYRFDLTKSVRGVALTAAAACLSMGLLVGCEDSSSTTTPPTNEDTSDTSDALSNLGKELENTIDETSKTLDETAEQISTSVEETANNLSEQAEQAQADVIAQAQGLYEQATSMLSEKNIEQAKALVSQLQGLSNKLPKDWQDKISALAKQVEAAASGLDSLGL